MVVHNNKMGWTNPNISPGLYNCNSSRDEELITLSEYEQTNQTGYLVMCIIIRSTQ